MAALALGSILACACGGTAASPATTSSPQAAATDAAVVNHVHDAVRGSNPNEILIATHYGLRRSEDGGHTWQPVTTAGDGMVAALARVPSGYVGSFMRMSSMNGTSGSGAMGSMSMSGTADVRSSDDGRTWMSVRGLPSGASVTNLVASPDGRVTWASINGQGIYRSTDGGRNWQQALPSNALITAVYDSGTSLIFSTQDGLDVTGDAQPSIPATPTVPTSMNAVSAWVACATCVIATTEHGSVETSRDGGRSWQQRQSSFSFDTVVSFASTGPVLFGMVADASDHNRGVWRSADGGGTWTRVLDQPLIDYAFGLPNGDLLAFQWGVHVWRSTNGGASWTRDGDA
ncbi:MAG: hypothetical protein QOG45_1660 [Chloroflexota bacterium]|jgi:hypothetical protein|nr:hypothetical protein [Chloroflexota bacterium]